jgi:hypothetical protein
LVDFWDGVETQKPRQPHDCLSRQGRYQLSVLDESDQTARLEFSVGE